MVRTLLLVDLETTGLEPATDRCIEVAIVRYDVPTASMVEAFTSLVQSDDNPAAVVNRIDSATLRRAPPPAEVWDRVRGVVERAAAPAVFVAHRAEFDRAFFPREIAERLPWVCSKFDIEFPKSRLGEALVFVALAHLVPVHESHRALSDTLLLARLFQRCAEMGVDVQATLARAMRPKQRFVALASFEQNEVVKAHGFSWNPATRVWERRMAPEDARALPFRVRAA
jgi:DNA polymerase-3 subunit epsilon